MRQKPKQTTPKNNPRKQGKGKASPRKTRSKNHTLTKSELKRFKQWSANNPKWNLLFSLILFFGMRVAEVVSIKLKDLSLKSRQVTLYGLKGGRTRTYNLPQPLFSSLQDWLEVRNQDPKLKDNPYLFPHRDQPGKPMTTIGVQWLFHSIANKAGIEGHSVHDLRHTSAMLQVEKGIDPVRLRNWLRQQSIRSTEKYFEEFQDRQYEKQVEDTFNDFI